MGRPLNKKYFGNRNIGSTTTIADNYIGGEGLLNASFSQRGSYTNRLPAILALSAPSLITGVQAVGKLHSQAKSAVVNANGAGYQINDEITDVNGVVWVVTGLRVNSFSVTANGTNYDLGNVVALDNTTNNGGNSSHWTSPFVINTITVDGDHGLTGGTIAQNGVWSGVAAPASFSLLTDNTRGTASVPNYGGTGDTNASAAAISVVWGVAAVTVKTGFAGDFASDATINLGELDTVGDGDNNCTVTVNYEAKSVVFSQAGSGYIGTEAITFSTVGGGETRAVGTVLLTQDSGPAYSATNQENAIIAYAYLPGTINEGYISGAGGSSNLISDIIKQDNDRRYKVRNTQGVGVCKLVTDGVANAPGEMTIKATDQSGHTYYVAKLTARKAVLVPFGAPGHEFPLVDGTAQSVKWTLGTPSTVNHKVQIENA